MNPHLRNKKRYSHRTHRKLSQARTRCVESQPLPKTRNRLVSHILGLQHRAERAPRTRDSSLTGCPFDSTDSLDNSLRKLVMPLLNESCRKARRSCWIGGWLLQSHGADDRGGTAVSCRDCKDRTWFAVQAAGFHSHSSYRAPGCSATKIADAGAHPLPPLGPSMTVVVGRNIKE